MKHLSFETTAVQESKHRSSRPPPSPPPSFFVLLLFSATQLPSYAASAYLFPGPRMAVINRAREAGIRGIKRATCCYLHVRASTYTWKKKISDDRPANPICNPVLGVPLLLRLFDRSLFVVDLCLCV